MDSPRNFQQSTAFMPAIGSGTPVSWPESDRRTLELPYVSPDTVTGPKCFPEN